MSWCKKIYCKASVEGLRKKILNFLFPSVVPIECRCKYFVSCKYAKAKDMVCESHKISSNVCMEWDRLHEKEERGL